MKTKLHFIPVMIIAGLVCTNNVHGQTALSGNAAASNGCATTAAAGTSTTNTSVGCGAGAAMTGTNNTSVGSLAGSGLSSGTQNTFMGYEAGLSTTTGSSCTYVGYQAGRTTTGGNNSFFGWVAGKNVTTGVNNTYIGTYSGFGNVTGSSNIAMGYGSGYSSGSASNNSFLGYNSGYSNTTGGSNTYVGYGTSFNNATGANNTIMGADAGKGAAGSSHSSNSFFGQEAGFSITTGSENTFVGVYAGHANTDGIDNTCMGLQAGNATTTGDDNTFIGHTAGNTNTTGGTNTCIGAASDVSGTGQGNSTALGYGATVNASNKVRVGNGSVTVCEAPVAWTSDGRFKTNVREDVKGLEFILKLRPVTYNFESRKFDEFLNQDNKENWAKVAGTLDYSKAESIVHSGFIAQEVEKTANEIGYNFGAVLKPENEKGNYSIAYNEFVVPLVKAVQEQQQQIETLQAENDLLKNDIAAMKQQLAQIDKGLSQCCLNYQLQGKATTGTGNNTSEVPALGQNSPNPFRENTVIKFYIPFTAKNAAIRITTSAGVEMKSYSITQKGNGEVMIAGGSFAAGTYYYTLIIDGANADTKTMVLSK